MRRTTDYFISRDPTPITLVPEVRTVRPGGAYDISDGPARKSQPFKIISLPGTLDGIVPGEGGSARQWSYIILGSHNCEMAIGDHWVDGDTTYRITAMLPSNGFERRGAVIAFGKGPDYGG